MQGKAEGYAGRRQRPSLCAVVQVKGKNMDFVIQSIVGPSVRRLGTAVGAWLVGLGMDADVSAQVQVGFVAAVLFAIDLAASHLNVLGRR